MTLPLGEALRTVFGETMIELGAEDPTVVMLDGDVGSSTGGALFEEALPDQYLQMGVAEQNMLGVAAGLAAVGFRPVVAAFACFVVGRGFDSIRVLIAQPALNVKMVGGYAGILTGMTGKTHQIFNDVAIMRTLANVRVLAPADEVEARQAIRAMMATPGPCYLQVTREPSPVLFGSDYQFRLGRAVRVRGGTDVTLVSTGVQTVRVYEAAELLAAEGIDAGVLHVPTIKPIDEAALVDVARTSEMIVVVEEQSVLGGLGGAVAEVLASSFPTTVNRLGIRDTYGESGPNERLLDKYRLSAAGVATDVQELLRESGAKRLTKVADG